MAMSQAANYVEKAVGHGDNATTEQNMTNPERDRQKYADPSGEKMKALAWMGKNEVQVSKWNRHDSVDAPSMILRRRTLIVECPKPKIIEDRDVILKVTGSTICGSDLHLLHGVSPRVYPIEYALICF